MRLGPWVAGATLMAMGSPKPALADPPGKDEPGPARASKAEAEPAWQTAPATRRSGFLLGVSLGMAIGKGAGYPNDARKIGRASSYAETDIGFGGSTIVWLGGALTDWLTFGVGLGGGGITAGDLSAGAGAFIFRTEVFPAFAMGGKLRELGTYFEAGGGGGTITPKDDTNKLLADSGSASRIAFGGFYDGIRLWRVSMGPFVGVDYTWSETMRLGTIGLGWRTALYAGSIQEPKPAPKSATR